VRGLIHRRTRKLYPHSVAMDIRVTETAHTVKLTVRTRKPCARQPQPAQTARPQPAAAANATADGNALRPLPHGWIDAMRHMRDTLQRTHWVVTVREDGTYALCSGAVRGNKIQAHRRAQQTAGLVDNIIDTQPEYCTFVTLTRRYDKTDDGRLQSWQQMQQQLPAYIRRLRRAGAVDYVWCKEAHYDGGCHVHMLVRWARVVKTVNIRGVLRARGRIKRACKDWDGHVDVVALDADTATVRGNYIAKELNKHAHCEDALRRARRHWRDDGDATWQAADVQRIWTLYYGSRLRQRLYGSARRMQAQAVETAEPIQHRADCASSPAVVHG